MTEADPKTNKPQELPVIDPLPALTKDLIKNIQVSNANQLQIQTETNRLLQESQKINQMLASNQAQNQAETNRLILTLNNNLIAISNNQNYAGDAKHLQVIGELRAINQINAGSCDMIKQIFEKPSEIVILSKIFDDILAELKAGADEGEVRYVSATASTTVTSYDFERYREPYHKVKSILVKNDGAVNIQVAVNVPDTIHFIDLLPDESLPLSFNRKHVSKVFIQSASSTAAFRMWYSW